MIVLEEIVKLKVGSLIKKSDEFIRRLDINLVMVSRLKMYLKMKIELADKITVGYASPGGKLESILKTTEKEIIKLV